MTASHARCAAAESIRIPRSSPNETSTKAGIDALKVQAERRADELGEARIASPNSAGREAEHEASGGCDVLEAENRLAEAKRALQKLEPLRDEYGKLKRSREQRRAFKNELDRAKQDCVAVQAQCAAARQALEQAAERAEGITAQSVEQEREQAERRLAEAQRQKQVQQIEQKLKERNAIETRITELTAHNETLNQQRGTIARALREKLPHRAHSRTLTQHAMPHLTNEAYNSSNSASTPINGIMPRRRANWSVPTTS